MVQNHGIFQGHYFFHHIGLDRDMRDQFRDHPHFERTAEFCRALRQPGLRPAGRDPADRRIRTRCCGALMAQPQAEHLQVGTEGAAARGLPLDTSGSTP